MKNIEAEAVAARIRESDTWIPEDCEELCRLAGLEEEYRDTDGDTFESVLFKAAEILGVEIIQDTVRDSNGDPIDFDAAAVLMDDDIREALHADLAPCSKQEFYDAYCKAHKGKYGEDFTI